LAVAAIVLDALSAHSPLISDRFFLITKSPSGWKGCDVLRTSLLSPSEPAPTRSGDSGGLAKTVFHFHRAEVYNIGR